MDVRFHCSKRVRHSGKKAKHALFDACKTVCAILRLNAYYGKSIPRFHELRKMRLRVPGYNVGKSGGYRLIYRAHEMDESIYVVYLETYSKGESEDLTNDQYKQLVKEADAILSQPMLYDWE